MKIFNKYVAMHVQCNYTDVISLGYKVYPSPPAKVIPQNSFQ